MREMVGGHVVDEGAGEFFAANVAIEPTQEKYQLNDGREAECPPGWILEDVHFVGAWRVILRRGARWARGARPVADVAARGDRREIPRLRVPALRAKAKARDTPLGMTRKANMPR